MKPTVIVSILSLFVFNANAQYIGAGASAQFGIGLHGGAGVCSSYNGRVPDGLVDVQDDINDYQTEIKELKAEIREIKNKREDLEESIEDYEKLLCASGSGIFKDNVCEGVKAHLKGRVAGEKGYWTPGAQGNVCGDGENKEISPWPAFCTKDNKDRFSQEANRWDEFAIDRSAAAYGKIQKKACSHNAFTADKYLKPSMAGAREIAAKNCKESLENLEDLYAQVSQYNEDTENALELRKEGLQARIDLLKKKRKRIIRDARDGETEANYCYNCHYSNDKPISTTQKVGSLLLGGLGAYLGYKGYKYGVDQSAKLGWPVAANPAVVMGGILPSVSMGIYGATNGFGAGGCGAGSPLGMYGPGGLYGTGLYPQTGGAFGYPAGMGGMMGGGLYAPGMGTWGMNGPWGGGMGGMYPGMGVPMAGGYPMAGGGGYLLGGIGGAGVGFLAGGYPMAGGGGMMMGGYPMAGGGMMMGMIGGGGMMAGGYPIAGGGMMMGGYPLGGGGMMMGGIGGGGFIGGGIPGGIGGYMGGGIPGGIGGYIGGGIPGGMMMGGIPGGGGFAGGMAGLQYQQQMLQMQQQQTQAWIQSQQRAQQDYYNRQQTVGQLQSQLVQIQMQIQQVQYGVYGSGYSSGGGVAPYPGQNPTAPYPGGPGYQPGYPGGPGYQPGYPGGPVAPYPGGNVRGGSIGARGP